MKAIKALVEREIARLERASSTYSKAADMLDYWCKIQIVPLPDHLVIKTAGFTLPVLPIDSEQKQWYVSA